MKLPNDKQIIVERHNKVVYDCGDTVAKVFNGNKPAADIFREAENLALAEQAGVVVPEIVEVSKTGRSWVIVTKKVEGKTLRQLIAEDPEHTDEYLERLVALELEVHTHRNPLMGRQKDKFVRMIESIPDIIDEATRYDLLVRLDSMPKHDKLCHGDFVPSNIIIPDKADSAPVIVDWAHATQGNGGADCAITYLHLKLNGEHDLAERYIKLYCERQGCTRDYINGWTSIVAAAELARGRVHETDFLMSWVDVFDGM